MQGSNIDRLRSELAAEFRDALLHAYHGPHIDMSARQLPTAFEADERTDSASPDILQLLSGRCHHYPVLSRNHHMMVTLQLQRTVGVPQMVVLTLHTTGSCWGWSGRGKIAFLRAAMRLPHLTPQQPLHSS